MNTKHDTLEWKIAEADAPTFPILAPRPISDEVLSHETNQLSNAQLHSNDERAVVNGSEQNQQNGLIATLDLTSSLHTLL
jgi:hypothetical protein